MDMKTRVKMMLLKKGMKQVELAEKYGMSKNTFNNFLQRDNFKISDIEKIANIIGFDIKIEFIDRETKEII